MEVAGLILAGRAAREYCTKNAATCDGDERALADEALPRLIFIFFLPFGSGFFRFKFYRVLFFVADQNSTRQRLCPCEQTTPNANKDQEADNNIREYMHYSIIKKLKPC